MSTPTLPEVCNGVGCPDDLCQGPGPTLCGLPCRPMEMCYGCPHCDGLHGEHEDPCYVCGDCDDFADGNPV